MRAGWGGNYSGEDERHGNRIVGISHFLPYNIFSFVS